MGTTLPDPILFPFIANFFINFELIFNPLQGSSFQAINDEKFSELFSRHTYLVLNLADRWRAVISSFSFLFNLCLKTRVDLTKMFVR